MHDLHSTLEPPHQNTALLRVYLYFRLTIGMILLGMFFTGAAPNVVGTAHPQLFLWATVTYISLSFLTLLFIPVAKLMMSFNRLVISFILDAVCVLIITHASGGIESGLGYLLVIYVAIASIFIRGQITIAYTAMICILVIGESLYLVQTGSGNSKALFSAGSLGLLLFAATFLFQYLTNRIRLSNVEAINQARFAEHLQRLAQSIVTRMRTGIIVTDQDGKIELINNSALQLLNLPTDIDYRDVLLNEIESLSPIKQALLNPSEMGPPRIHEVRQGLQARISASILNLGETTRTVLYLEDHRVMKQQAQQLKLASLGRLTASIAHEVRNPLGAISHAAQLLAESPSIAPEDKRFTEIIQQHSERVNQIVESTLTMSRRQDPMPELIELDSWMAKFLQQYNAGQNAQIDYQHETAKLKAKMDPTQLSQVLTNLLDNAVRYSEKTCGERTAILRVSRTAHDDTAVIDIIDQGAGIPESDLAQIFEPFYTTDSTGTGLGLYISKELCEINQASLLYRRTKEGLSCFRIDFSHHQRMF